MVMKLRKFLKRDQGATMVEYALVAPVFILIMCGLFEISAVLFVLVTLDSATNEISRFGRTGDTISGETQLATARRILIDHTYGLVDTTKVVFRIQPVLTFASADTSPATVESVDFGGTSSNVIYTITYPWTIITPFISTAAFGGSPTVNLSSTAVVKNEPFAE
jgi:Flp pilus assembly protein TadG